jgi:hypothetical protein
MTADGKSWLSALPSKILVLAAAYFVVGILTLAANIPPVIVTVVWLVELVGGRDPGCFDHPAPCFGLVGGKTPDLFAHAIVCDPSRMSGDGSDGPGIYLSNGCWTVIPAFRPWSGFR